MLVQREIANNARIYPINKSKSTVKQQYNQDLSNVYQTINIKANKSQVPKQTSQLVNDSGFINTHQDISGKANISDLATVAFTGDYNDLKNKITATTVIGSMHRSNVSGSGSITITNTSGQFPVINSAGEYTVVIYMQSQTSQYGINVSFGSNTYVLNSTNGIINDSRTLEVNANSRWSASVIGSVASNTIIEVKIITPSLPVQSVGVAAVTNDYNDLSNKPTIPTKTSQLINDSGYTTEQQVDNMISDLVDGAPEMLDTLYELSQALGDDPNFAATITSEIAEKYTKPDSGIPVSDLSDYAQQALSLAETSLQSEVDPVFTTSAAFAIQNSDITNWNNKGTYSLPDGGIPLTHLSSSVQTSLSKADSALQEYTETDPTVPTYVKSITQQNIQDWNNKGTYSKPSTGIPKNDLDSSVQTSLGKADTAIQTETDPVFLSSAAHSITNSDIISWNNKQNALVSGTNIKTVNNKSLLGSGNIDVGSNDIAITNAEIDTIWSSVMS